MAVTNFADKNRMHHEMFEEMPLDDIITVVDAFIDDCRDPDHPALFKARWLKEQMSGMRYLRDHARVALKKKAIAESAEPMATIAMKKLGVDEFECETVQADLDRDMNIINIKRTYKTKDGRSIVVQLSYPK